MVSIANGGKIKRIWECYCTSYTARSLGALKLKQGPVGILWSDEMPENALGYKGCGGGCIMVLFAQVAAKGKQAAFDRDNFDCFGGLCSGFGKQCYKFSLGGVGALGKDMFTFAVPHRRFEEMEANVEESFLKKRTWRSLMEI